LYGKNLFALSGGTGKGLLRTVLQTDAGELVENTTAIERTVLKELGKLTL